MEPFELSFDNTEIAFSHLSDEDLLHAQRMYRMINRPALQSIGAFFTKLALKAGLPVEGLIKRFIFRQFCGGETLQESIPVIQKMAEHKVFTALDYGVEGKDRESDFEHTAEVMIRNLEFAKSNTYIPFISCKLTGLARFGLLEKIHAGLELTPAEQEEWQRFHDRFEKICQKAFEENTALFVDAEETWIQQPIDDIVHEMMVKFNCEKPLIFNTVQLYRTDRLEFLRQSVEEAEKAGYFYGIKLVRGAYMDKERERAAKNGYPDPIHATKEDTDLDFNEAIRFCIDHIDRVAVCAATHNEKSSALQARLLHERGIPRDHPHVTFAQLYGMSDHITYNLARAGFRAGKYLPYGPVKEVLPYLIRRAKENTSVAGQMSRELQLVSTELKRRGLV